MDVKLDVPARRAMEAVRPVHRVSLSDKIIEQITDLIGRGLLKAGDRLPAERELCKRFGVGRTSLREALRSLAVMGILEGRVGEGTFVSTNSTHLEKTLKWGLLLDAKKVQDLIETRLTLECQTAFLAAQRASGEDLEEIRRTLEGMATALEQPDQYLEFDLQFHLVIARATQNSILYSLLSTTRNYLQEWIEGSLAEPTAWQAVGRATLSLQEHERILQALIGRDAELAREAMSRHILSSSVDLQAHVRKSGK